MCPSVIKNNIPSSFKPVLLYNERRSSFKELIL